MIFRQRISYSVRRAPLVIVALLFSTAILGCRPNCSPSERLDYSLDVMWYGGLPDVSYSADVFYILPTCVWDWSDSCGVVHHYADIDDSLQRHAMKYSFDLAKSIFAEGFANYFAPYYRQSTLESWMQDEELIEQRFALAMNDIEAAFDYYMTNLNNQRPFVLAGFSQGAKGVVELLKRMDRSVRARMVAAYVVGYKVTEVDLSDCPSIRPASGADDTGVTICYNSVSSPQSICAQVGQSAICINPLNWRCDNKSAQLNDSVRVEIDTMNHVLIVSGEDQERLFLPSLGAIFPKGNYHLQELHFYADSLHENVKRRIDAFMTADNGASCNLKGH